MTNGFSHHYHLGESSFSFRSARSVVSFLSHFSMNFRLANRMPKMGRRVLQRHIWGYAVCLCPIKTTPDINELR